MQALRLQAIAGPRNDARAHAVGLDLDAAAQAADRAFLSNLLARARPVPERLVQRYKLDSHDVLSPS
jgi:hypothetical protein